MVHYAGRITDETVRFTNRVVAICNDQSEEVAQKCLGLGRTFEFTATFKPRVGAVYRLSITVNKDTTVYLHFTTSHLKSLEKTRCDHNKKRYVPFFDTISRHLDNHRSFTRLQFRLSRQRADIITPKEFDIHRCDAKARRTFDAIASLTTAFSLYMPCDTLQKNVYQVFYTNLKQYLQMVDIRTIYEGEGGVTFDLDQYRESETETAVITVDVDRAPGHESQPACGNTGCSSPLTTSQQSTASESQLTVAVDTPAKYKGGNGNQDRPPPYSQASADAPPHGSPEMCSKHDLSFDETESGRNAKKSRLRAMDVMSRPNSIIEILLQIHNQLKQQQEHNENVMKALVVLQSRDEDREQRYNEMESRQESVEQLLSSVDCEVDDLRVCFDASNTEVNGIRQEIDAWKDDVDDYVNSSMDDALVTAKQHLDDHMVKKRADMNQVDVKAGLKDIFKDVLGE